MRFLGFKQSECSSVASALSSAPSGRGISNRKTVSFFGIAVDGLARSQGAVQGEKPTPDLILHVHDHEGEFRVPDHDAFQPNSVHTA